MTLKLTDCVQGNGTVDSSECAENSQTDERSIDKDVKTTTESQNSGNGESQSNNSRTENENTATDVVAVEKENTDKRNHLCKQERVLHEDEDDTNVEEIIVQEQDNLDNKLHVPAGLTQRFLAPKLPNLISFSSDGSVDVDESAHEQLRTLNEITTGKSWDDELKEDIQEIESQSKSTTDEVDTAEDLGDELKSNTDKLSGEDEEIVDGTDTVKPDTGDENELVEFENKVETDKLFNEDISQLEQSLYDTEETNTPIQGGTRLEVDIAENLGDNLKLKGDILSTEDERLVEGTDTFKQDKEDGNELAELKSKVETDETYHTEISVNHLERSHHLHENEETNKSFQEGTQLKVDFAGDLGDELKSNTNELFGEDEEIVEGTDTVKQDTGDGNELVKFENKVETDKLFNKDISVNQLEQSHHLHDTEETNTPIQEGTQLEVDIAENLGDNLKLKANRLPIEDEKIVEGIDTFKHDKEDGNELVELKNKVETDETFNKEISVNQLEQNHYLHETEETNKPIQQGTQLGLEDKDSADQDDRPELVELKSDPPVELPEASPAESTPTELDPVQPNEVEHRVASLDSDESIANEPIDTSKRSCEGDSENSIQDADLSETVPPNNDEIQCYIETKDSLDNESGDVDTLDISIISENQTNEISVSVDSSIVDLLKMPESRTSQDGCPSPSLMYATCRYRWERSVVTQSDSVVFVTLNKKEVEPIKLEWTEGSKCFYSEELKIPIGAYVGNLVIDGTFYPVEDISVKHYTFEVDLYLKDDILEDESARSTGEKSYTVNGGELKPKEVSNGSPSPDYNHVPVKTASYTYSPIRARMEEEPKQPANQPQPDGSIHVSSKYENLVRSQMTHTKNVLIDSDSDGEIAQSTKSNLSDGRRSPIGGDGAKQYQDSDDTATRFNTGCLNGIDANSTALKEVVNGSLVEDDVERKSVWSGLELGPGQPQGIVDDVLGNGQNRAPIYCTESPIHSRNSSAHSSARQTPTAVSIHSSARQTPTQGDGQEAVRPDSTTSTHSANSVSRHLVDDIFNDALGRNRASPAREGSQSGSQSGSREGSHAGSNRHTPQIEQIDDVLNPSDRHSPIRRDYLAGSNYSAHSSAQGSTHGSVKGSAAGSLPGSIHGSLQGSNHGSKHGSVVGSTHNSLPGSTHGSLQGSAHSSTRGSIQGSVPGSTHGSHLGSTHNSIPGSAHSSQRQTPQPDFITDTLRATEEKLYSLGDVHRLSGSEHASNHGSHNGSRPQSLTSEQELTQYYDSLVDSRRTPVPGSGSRTPSASSLPAIGTQQGSTDKRSKTPDNYIRVPAGAPATTTAVKAELLQGRVTPRNTPVSNASSRTITPVNPDVQETRDLESTVATLRTLLASREPEVLELKAQFTEVKDINRKLQGDLDRLRARASPGPQIAELERKYREALEEREIVKAEALRLKEELRRKDEPSLNDYDPNGPTALQRKIEELSSQISDLQEVNETAMEEVRASEKRVKELAAENEMLRVTQSSRAHGTEEENRQLKSEVARLREQHMAESNLGDFRVKIELQQVKEDNRNLRERNYQLHDDNIMLKEELSNLRKSLEMVDSFKKQHKEERVSSTRVLESYARDSDKEKLLETNSYPRELSNHGKLRPDPLSDRTDLSLETEKSRNSYYHALLETRSRLEAEKDRKLEYTETKARYDSPIGSRYESRTTTTVRGEKEYEDRFIKSRGEKEYEDRFIKSRGENEYEDRFTKSEPARYEHYRSIPDGDVSDKPSRPSPLYDARPLTPERPSSLGPSKDLSSGPRSIELSRFDRYQHGDRERSRRARTTSAEIEYRSMPITGYPTEMSKTTPALSGRSKAIYKEISNLRNRSRLDDWNSPQEIPTEYPREFPRESPQLCESESQNNQEPATLHTNKNRSQTSKVFVNRYVTNNQQGEGHVQSGDTKLPSATRDGDFSNIRASQSRQQVLIPLRPADREEKGYDVHASSGYQDEGDVSDTATDILVNASPLDRVPASWNQPRPRRGSVGSEGSNSSFSDIDEQLTATARKRSKSADGREILRRMAPTGSTSRSGATTPVKGERPLSRTMSPAPTSAGFRTVTPKPMPTQHNKSMLSFSTSNTLTHGLRPFAPRSAGDLQVKDVIKFSRQGGKLSQGTIKFLGHLPGRGDIYLGVELDKEDGKHDGTFEGNRYFRCKPSKGVFVAYNKVVMAWTSY